MRQPQLELGVVQHLLQHHHDHHGQQLAADQRDVLERREEAALPAHGHFAHVGGGGAVLAADRQALQQARGQQQRGRGGADLRIGGQAGNDQRAHAHHRDRDHHRGLAALAVGQPAEQPAAHRAHQEAGGEHAGRVQQLHRRVRLGEEGRREVDGAEGVDVEVEPFDEVARRSGKDGEDALALFFEGVGRVLSASEAAAVAPPVLARVVILGGVLVVLPESAGSAALSSVAARRAAAYRYARVNT
jgi:hypothetical protein